ncbi:hypothetical protein [Nocardioides sp. LHG3406-4]|uniref:hypothetical protein n=1 Tax=Nocardioides sp. LHG3406-4 TaxID=2804575 RepID=UPI003CFA0935
MPRTEFRFPSANRDWPSIQERLDELGIPAALQVELRTKLAGSMEGLLLYGSWARGDANDYSDLDVLAVGYRGLVPASEGRVSFSSYSADELRAATGTLFGHHLARDGVILLDRDGVLSSVLSEIRPPTAGSVATRIRDLSPVLDVSETDELKYIEGLTKVARYLLRSALYAEALDAGQPCYSVREIAQRREEPELAMLLSSHEGIRPVASLEVLNDLGSRLAAVVGPLQANPFRTLHGLIEGSWDTNRELSNFATLCLAVDDEELPYDELPKVVL